MSTTQIQVPPFQRLLREIAQEYKSRGYSVTVEPTGDDLPDFLDKYRPDIIARGPDESVVVEVRAPSKARRLDYWGELAADVKRHPGWRLDLIVRNDDNKDMSPISLEDIEGRLQDGASLAESKKLNAALLITWSAFEAAAMQAANQQDVRLSHKSVAALISTLYTEGLIDREDYDTLMQCMRLRSQIAHGVQSSPIDSSCIQEIQRIARELLDQDFDVKGSTQGQADLDTHEAS